MSTRKIKLNDVTSIQFGTTIKTSNSGRIPCIQVSNITFEGDFDLNSLVYVKNESDIETDALLHAKDILLAAKGDKMKSVLVADRLNLKAIASSSLFIIRTKSNEVLPEYLQWYINLPHTQWILDKEATGTNISSLSIKSLRHLSIEIPDVLTQKKIVELKLLQNREKKIMERLSVKRKTLIEAITKNLIHREIK